MLHWTVEISSPRTQLQQKTLSRSSDRAQPASIWDPEEHRGHISAKSCDWDPDEKGIEAHVDASKVSTSHQAKEVREGSHERWGSHGTDGPSGEGKKGKEDASASKLHAGQRSKAWLAEDAGWAAVTRTKGKCMKAEISHRTAVTVHLEQVGFQGGQWK